MQQVIWVLLALTMGLFFFSYLKVKAKVGVAEARIAELRNKQAPLIQAKKEFKSAGHAYEEIQSDYQKMYGEYKENMVSYTLYDIGIGTVDSVPYKTLMHEDSLEKIDEELTKVKGRIKALVKTKKACVCNTEWAVNNKKSEGTKMTNKEIRLRLRCFDNECKAALALVSWHNINRLIERVTRAFNDINASGQRIDTLLQRPYLEERIKELRISYEYTLLKHRIRDEEREDRARYREAEREQKAIVAAAHRAKKEREEHEQLINEELNQLKELHGDEYSQLQQRVKEQQEELKQLIAAEKRTLSMAQQTRAGYVYVISNRQSFGEGVYKIGMTRRINPYDRVKELGDASVPFLFDVHALAYTDDAPAVEKKLHRKFKEKRVNLVNFRKEYFFVDLDNVVQELQAEGEAIELQLFDAG